MSSVSGTGESEARIRDEILTLVAVQLGVVRREIARRPGKSGGSGVRPEDRLIGDLGAESSDLLNLVANLEERFGITIAEEELPDLVTVEDLIQRVWQRVCQRVYRERPDSP